MLKANLQNSIKKLELLYNSNETDYSNELSGLINDLRIIRNNIDKDIYGDAENLTEATRLLSNYLNNFDLYSDLDSFCNDTNFRLYCLFFKQIASI